MKINRICANCWYRKNGVCWLKTEWPEKICYVPPAAKCKEFRSQKRRESIEDYIRNKKKSLWYALFNITDS